MVKRLLESIYVIENLCFILIVYKSSPNQTK